MKTISIVIPVYNEEENVQIAYERIRNIFKDALSQYSYEIVFIDNYSTDNTRHIVSEICNIDRNVKAIFNAKNFGFIRSTFYGLLQTHGDCSVLIFADMQDPPEVICDFVREWENGYKIVVGIKNKSKENILMYFFRSSYYKLIKSMADIEHIEHFTGFGLYDKDFIQILHELDDPMPYLRGIVAELGFQRKDIFYVQNKRERGKSSFNFLKLYDLAMLGITSYTKVVMRIATILGFVFSAVSLIIALLTIVLKLFFWDSYPIGTAAIMTGVFLLGSVQIFFIGFLGEYILNINTRIMKRPLVIVEKRINFVEKDSKC